MHWFVDLFRGYDFLGTSKDGARDMYCIKGCDTGLAGFFQGIFNKGIAGGY